MLNWVLMPRLRLWKWFIIAASYVFYAWWDWRLVFLLLGATLVNQALGVQVHHALGRRGWPAAARSWVVLAVAVNLVTLGVFKYFDFFVVNLNDVLGAVGLGAPLPLLRIMLPVGISFLVFRMLTYVIDIYRGQLAPAPALDFAVYTAFFPYLLAGPIARAREFLPQLTSPRNPHAVDSSRAFVLILGGLVKKLLIADYLSTHIVNGLFASPQTYSSWETLLGHRRLLGADLLRLQRLRRHRHRRLAAARLRAAGQLRRAVHGAHHPGVLAPLAHHPLELAARLPVHTTGG